MNMASPLYELLGAASGLNLSKMFCCTEHKCKVFLQCELSYEHQDYIFM